MKKAPVKQHKTPPQPGHAAGIKSQNSKTDLLFMLIIALLCTALYFPALTFSIDVWDDPYYVTENLTIRSFSNLGELFTNSFVGNYQPVTILSYMIEYAIVKNSPFLYHLDNMLLHIINAVLCFLLITKLAKNSHTGFVAGVLFAVHPLHIESVAWISQRKDLLYCLFYFLSIIFYLSYKEKNATKYLLISLVMFVLSCLSKGMAIVLPLTLILIDFSFGKKFTIRSQANKIPFILISIILGILAVAIQKESGAVGFTSKDIFSAGEKFFFVNYSHFFYIWKMILPFHLSGLYPYPMQTGSLPVIFYLSAAFNLLILAGVIFSLRYSRKILFGYGFYLINVIMILQILSVGSAIAADRYFYVASAGLFYLAGIGISKISELQLFKKIKYFSFIILAFITVYFSVISFTRMPVWKNSGTFWTDVTQKHPEIDVAWFNAGAYYFSNKQYDESLRYFDRAIAINPENLRALEVRSAILSDKKNFQGALNDYLKIIEIDSNKADAYSKAGEIYGKYLNDIEKSIYFLTKAVAKNPRDERACCNLGVAYSIKADHDHALNYFLMAYHINPDDPTICSNLSTLYRMKGNLKKSDEFLNRAKQLASGQPKPQ
ncbi:MAG TPA: tetratricopeptide repeat protein [Bacteroidales bacterium]|nr:tetratricopeptide repeat protein [Bacteroidales bacterium]